MSSGRVLVVGAGVAGLSAAYRLRGAGYEVVVLEARDRVGGLLRTEQREGALLEWAANGFLDNTEGGAVDLADELGVEMQCANEEADKRWVYSGGKLHRVPTGPGSLFASGLFSIGGKFRACTEPFRKTRSTEGESVHDFVARRLGPQIATQLIGPFVTGIFGGDSQQLALDAAFPKMAALERDGGLIRGALRKRKRDRKSGKPKSRGMMAPLHGVGALIGALGAKVEDLVRTSAKVASIEGGASGVRIQLEDGSTERADALVLATPASAASALVQAAHPELAELLQATEFVNLAVVHLCYPREAILHPADGFGFLVRAGEDLRILGCVFESVVYRERAPQGQLLLRCILGGTREPEVLDHSDDELVAIARDDIRSVLGESGDPEFCSVVRHERAIPQYTQGHVERVRTAETLAEGGRIVLAGNSYHGVSVNDCIADAKRVVSRLTSLLAVLAVLCVAACSGRGVVAAKAPGDGGDHGAADSAPLPPRGSLEASVKWLEPPAKYLKTSSTDGCGMESSPPLRIHSAGGVVDAVVVVPGDNDARPDPVEIELVACKLSPRVSALSASSGLVRVRSRREARTELVLESLDGNGDPLGFELAVIGQQESLELKQGVYRIAGVDGGLDPAYVVVLPGAHLTDETGTVRVEKLEAGLQEIAVWHPPGIGREPWLRSKVEIREGPNQVVLPFLVP